MPCCASKIHQGALWRCRAGGQVHYRSTWNNQKRNKNTPFWQVQATVKRNKRPCASFLMSGGFTHRTRTVCCVVSLSVAMLDWQQRWLQRAPTDACCSIKHNMIIWAKKSKRSRRIQWHRFCTLVLVTKSDKAIINSSYLRSSAVLALGGSSLSPNAMKTLNVFTGGKTGLGLWGQLLHVTEEVVTWEKEVKCAGRRGWVGKQ